MRRLVKHGIAGVGFAAFTVTTAVAALSSPAGQDTAIAVPAPQAIVAPSSVPSPTVSDAALVAETAARGARESRDAARAQLSATAARQALKRETTLEKQNASVADQQKKLKAAKAKAEAKAKAAAEAAEKARQLVIENQGYEPGTTDPREMARQILKNKYGYGADQYGCFNYIIMRESKWNVTAENRSSGAYGIPQALPGRKMASVGSDWRTNPATQIIWGINYMKSRYGSPCSAKGFKASHGWY